MIRRKDEQTAVMRNIRGGIGEVEQRSLLNGADEMYAKGRTFAKMTIAPGNSIGEHAHAGDNEIFYILSGSGLYNDNGTETRVSAGDVTVCNDGESHSLLNDGAEPIELIALILYS